MGCGATADCAALGAGFTCTGFSLDNVCVPACATDLDCGADLLGDALEATAPWDYLSCAPATGVCGG